MKCYHPRWGSASEWVSECAARARAAIVAGELIEMGQYHPCSSKDLFLYSVSPVCIQIWAVTSPLRSRTYRGRVRAGSICKKARARLQPFGKRREKQEKKEKSRNQKIFDMQRFATTPATTGFKGERKQKKKRKGNRDRTKGMGMRKPIV
ncbi:hypothetical protein DM02DRAFT_258213 [Periconia macrospinosa]|uniref:Uncharacterized protein n=1 Tax=Periconia macrospinosa TaxID=97972 RepID=A0A2V1E169_9PLEO|nr:hypothetical protein DM02DRAFT_258213 [Periconia macrospinosa]